MFVLALSLSALFPGEADAHVIDQGVIFLNIEDGAVLGRIEITIADLNTALDLGLDTKKSYTIDDLGQYLDTIKTYVTSRIALAPDGVPMAIELTNFELRDVSFGQFVLMDFAFEGLSEAPLTIDVKYEAIFDISPNHTGVLVIEHNWRGGVLENEANVSLIFTPDNSQQQLDLTDSSILTGLNTMIGQGVHHIWIGIDHILFLLALLLPSVMRRSQGHWRAVDGFKPAIMHVIKIVTVFTLAHTITLSLGATGVIMLPSRLVESVIAFSIAVAALDIIFPIFRGRIWLVVFGFGLFHGFGFASVLGEIGIPQQYMVYSLLGFNVGVELGQLAIVGAVFPALFLGRRFWIYENIVMRFGAVALIVISLYWFIERAFEVDLPAGAIVNSIFALFG